MLRLPSFCSSELPALQLHSLVRYEALCHGAGIQAGECQTPGDMLGDKPIPAWNENRVLLAMTPRHSVQSFQVQGEMAGD